MDRVLNHNYLLMQFALPKTPAVYVKGKSIRLIAVDSVAIAPFAHERTDRETEPAAAQSFLRREEAGDRVGER